MAKMACWLLVAAAVVCMSRPALAQETIVNWEVPHSWSPPVPSASKGEPSTMAAEAIEAVPTPPLPFVGLAPCRLADTRGNGFTGQYGQPALTQGVPRNFVLAGQCGISPTAQAVSLNVTVTNTQGPGFILIYPQGAPQPTVSTLNYVGGQTIANAAIVPLGADFGITVVAGVSGADLILDTNGDYEAGVVTSVNGIAGAVTLAPGSNISITPSGQTLTIASTGGLPAGTANQTLRNDGANWVASSALKNNGTNLEITGALNLPVLPRITVQGVGFLHSPGTLSNTMVGNASGPEASFTGTENTGVGSAVFFVNTTGSNNTAVGTRALTGNVGGSNNTALGHSALDENSTGSSNIAVGRAALSNITTGNSNIGIGVNVGTAVTTGSNNIYIGSPGFNNESGQIRIGDNAFQVGTVIAGISGAGVIGGAPVYVNGGGRMGTVNSSSRRYKDEIRNIGADSDRLMDLRPVAFKYKAEYDEIRLQQYGLIAEEVAEIYPELVVYDEEGQPAGIRYHLLEPLLLNEVQKQRRTIDEQRAELDAVKAKLVKLEAAVLETKN